MKVIDAHTHFNVGNPYFDRIAAEAGQENTEAFLLREYARLQYAGGVVMGDFRLHADMQAYPAQLHYCLGLNMGALKSMRENARLDAVEAHLRSRQCVGVKLYPGYDPVFVSDPLFHPVYELLAHYKKAAAVHMGLTATPHAKLKYSHPLTLDEAAADFPSVQFVMCHFGSPFLMDAAAVVMKNPNVAVDLSGLLEGRPDIDQLFTEQSGYMESLRAWLRYAGRFDAVMYGTDWPLVSLEDYIAFISRIVPEAHLPGVLFHNANRIYGLGLYYT